MKQKREVRNLILERISLSITKKDLGNILDALVGKYFPHSSKLIEDFILGKLVSSVGGIEKIYRLPASTIQLIGAERALFKHLSLGNDGPKYGLLYYSEKVEHNGKLARKLACKLAISLKQDYFQKFKPDDEKPNDSG